MSFDPTVCRGFSRYGVCNAINCIYSHPPELAARQFPTHPAPNPYPFGYPVPMPIRPQTPMMMYSPTPRSNNIHIQRLLDGTLPIYQRTQ